MVPIGSAKHTLDNEDDSMIGIPNSTTDFEAEETEDRISTHDAVIPDIIQFAIVAKDEQGFSGVDDCSLSLRLTVGS